MSGQQPWTVGPEVAVVNILLLLGAAAVCTLLGLGLMLLTRRNHETHQERPASSP